VQGRRRPIFLFERGRYDRGNFIAARFGDKMSRGGPRPQRTAGPGSEMHQKRSAPPSAPPSLCGQTEDVSNRSQRRIRNSCRAPPGKVGGGFDSVNNKKWLGKIEPPPPNPIDTDGRRRGRKGGQAFARGARKFGRRPRRGRFLLDAAGRSSSLRRSGGRKRKRTDLIDGMVVK